MGTERTFRIFSDDLYVSLDLHKKTGFAVNKSCNADCIQQALAKLNASQENAPIPDWTKLIQTESLTIDHAEPMRLQLENFVHCVRTSDKPIVTGSDGAAAVTVAEAIVQALKDHHFSS